MTIKTIKGITQNVAKVVSFCQAIGITLHLLSEERESFLSGVWIEDGVVVVCKHFTNHGALDMLEFIKALMAIGFTENQANQIAMAEQVEECTKTWAKERSAQLWFSRWHEGLRLLVWESQAPGPDYFAMTVNIEDALNELLNPVLQLDFRDAPENLLILYKREHSAKYVVYDNGSDYRLVAYEYFPPNANESTKRSEAGVAYPLILDEQKLAQPGDGFDPWSYSTDSPNSTDDCIRFADGIECIIWREGRWQLEPDDREESTD